MAGGGSVGFLVARGGSNYSEELRHIAIFISKMALNATNEKQLNADSQNTLGAPLK
jgi:hypothetical protein